ARSSDLQFPPQPADHLPLSVRDGEGQRPTAVPYGGVGHEKWIPTHDDGVTGSSSLGVSVHLGQLALQVVDPVPDLVLAGGATAEAHQAVLQLVGEAGVVPADGHGDQPSSGTVGHVGELLDLSLDLGDAGTG